MMTQRKFKPTTRGGYWARNVETRETDWLYPLQAEIGNHSSETPSDDPKDWSLESFRENGRYLSSGEANFDLIEDTE